MYMDTNSSIFIDTSFLCAFYNKNDSQFDKSNTYIELLNNRKLYTSNFVLLEAYTVLSQRVSKKVALEFGKIINDIEGITTIRIDESTENNAWEIFEKITDKDMSYVDCSSIAIMHEYSIKQILTFDSHLKKHSKQFRFKIV